MELANSLPPHMQSCRAGETEIHFTPVKTSNAPRVWDRKPSTSYLARSKPRKVWKRFRSSFNSMKALQQLIAPDPSGLKESALLLEINTSRNTEYSRGIKRQCLAGHTHAEEDDSAGNSTGRSRSFLETKWESEVSRKRRKIPTTTHISEHMIADDPQDEEDDEMAEIGDAPGGTTSIGSRTMQDPEKTGESPTPTPALSEIEAAYPDVLPGEAVDLPSEPRGVIANIKSPDGADQDEVRCLTSTDVEDSAAATDHDETLDVAAEADQQVRSDVAKLTTSAEDSDTMAVPVEPEELTAEQESTLVRSALRSSLDGEDTALLNNFLSKAKAKREAKAAAEAEAATVIAADPEEVEERKEEELESVQPPQHQVFVEIPTPERRVLEALDANSPSPAKSPSKPEKEEDNSGSPVARRSTRTRGLQRAAAPTGFRTALSLRRARGNEFVFLQRTEAQELALQTRRNTKQNKGNSLHPKYTLQGLARQTPDSSPTTDENARKTGKPKKCVTWNDDRLVEYEGESSEDELSRGPTTIAKPVVPAKAADKKRAASSRPPATTSALKTGGPVEKTAAAAAPTTASPTATRTRRVRRLGPPKPLAPTTIDASDVASSSPPSPTTTGQSQTQIASRKKLTPKSPKPVTKTPSKVPTPVAKGADDVPSLLSGGRSVKTSLLKVNAGSTPMPRRVRRA
ncbi:uncharacterized protein BDV14DRAFT_189883 [Aspergillus stella-maris]|uniref:uncharacterized protein n=1 Tax=Aspergillus stella-maris TaxID=1810926 RepID=UPI003CCCE2A7